MKKFLKVFIIVLLVIGVIGVTCYFFFRKIKERNNTTEPLTTILYSENNKKFKTNLGNVAGYVKGSTTDSRIYLIVETNQKLDDLVEVLSSYYIAQNTQINNESIAKALSKVNSSKSLLSSMMNEYILKKDSTYFNRHTGANDLYKQGCNYLVNYATFANLLNASLNVDRNSDLRFNMFEVYCNVVISTFSATHSVKVGEDFWVYVSNTNNINTMNAHFAVYQSHIVTSVHSFDKTINDFNKYYKISNKITFANDLTYNVNNVSSKTGTNEEIATYYFKLIYGI